MHIKAEPVEVRMNYDIHYNLPNEFQQFDNQVPSTSTSSAPSPMVVEVKNEESESEADSDSEYHPSGRSSVNSVCSNSVRGQKRKRGRPAKPLKKLPPLPNLNSKERESYNRERNNEASRISRRNKREAELGLEEVRGRLENQHIRLLAELQRLESRKARYTSLAMSLATR